MSATLIAPPETPTEHERAGMAWWNSLTPWLRTVALDYVGKRIGQTPSPADCWDWHSSGCLPDREAIDEWCQNHLRRMTDGPQR